MALRSEPVQASFEEGSCERQRDDPVRRATQDNPERDRRLMGRRDLTGRDRVTQPYAIVPAVLVNEPDILWHPPRMHLRTAIVSLLALGLVAWFLRHANIADVWAQVQQANVALLIVGFVFVMATYWARA